MKILFIGDIVSSPGREAVKKILPRLQKQYALDFVIANAENAAGGSGITRQVADELFDAGVSVLTSGDHIWKKKEIFEIIDRDPRILRPLNFPKGSPGKGADVFTASSGEKIAVVNLQGRVFMEALDCPFRAIDEQLEDLKKRAKVVIVDIHAEATSEKIAMGWFLDGRVSAVLGTHTHIQTADEKILPAGTAYLTDAGMTGPYYSVIGRRVEDVLKRFLTSIPVKFEVAQDDIQLHACLVEIDPASGKAILIKRLQEKLND
ncbi:MAG: TIGR00282 family metallophosphoesterase [Candidatus Omnitrophica bacterium]|jgi:hypothetical protein|nr:TIGR00282 family metallophosphoesterase [Candidatus Omnitrophota bacterium]